VEIKCLYWVVVSRGLAFCLLPVCLLLSVLSVSQSVCLFVYLFICQFVYLFGTVCISIWLQRRLNRRIQEYKNKL
jgi:hypothetical protein